MDQQVVVLIVQTSQQIQVIQVIEIIIIVCGVVIADILKVEVVV
jgi:hypothetical protein